MNARRRLPVLPLLFVCSGCAALIYEIVWFQLLQLVIGASAVSLGVLLGTFMGGMCLGSSALPRVVSARQYLCACMPASSWGSIIGITVLLAMPPALAVSGIGMGGSGLVGIFLLRGVASACAWCRRRFDGRDAAGDPRWGRDDTGGRAGSGSTAATSAAPSWAACSPVYLLRVYDAADGHLRGVGAEPRRRSSGSGSRRGGAARSHLRPRRRRWSDRADRGRVLSRSRWGE